MEDGKFRPVFDGHCDTATRIAAEANFDIGKRHSGGHIDIPRMKEGGLNAQIFAVHTDPDYPEKLWEEKTFRAVDIFKRAVEANNEEMKIALRGGDITGIIGGGRIAAVIGVEGGHVVSSIDVLKRLYEEGVRCLTITWKNTNTIADSSEDRKRWGGLSGFGCEIIEMMDRLGMIIDCSHASREAFFDVLERSSNPVILSHSCMSAICDIPRNTDDSQLLALAENGGVVCVNYFPAFLEEKSHRDIMKIWSVYRNKKSILSRRYGGDPDRASNELRPAAVRKLRELTMPNLSLVADHIDHAVGVAGVDHVGIGSDFDGIPLTPKGLGDISFLPDLDRELRRRGYSAADTGKIMGGNLLRVTSAVCG
ncbi:MAG TPA: dipeptidase [Candidatus Krumholzibacteriaceae bacterium]|nr:dipeptidase [Candidatus Krumholzibacteriaceae bacterium]